MAPPMHEKRSEKRGIGAPIPVSREGETKRPRIRDDPMLVKKIGAMIADGKTIAEIAREIGYSWSTVKSYLQHASLERI
jgi:DNA invertase Pin-like site-specific DNA recombinase